MPAKMTQIYTEYGQVLGEDLVAAGVETTHIAEAWLHDELEAMNGDGRRRTWCDEFLLLDGREVRLIVMAAWSRAEYEEPAT